MKRSPLTDVNFQVLRADSRRIYTLVVSRSPAAGDPLNRSLGWRCLGASLLGAAGVVGFAPLGWFPAQLAEPRRPLRACSARNRRPRTGPPRCADRRRHGLGLFLTGVSWVYVSLSVFGGMPAAWRAWRRCSSAACWRSSRRWPGRSSFASPRRLAGLAPCSSPPCGCCRVLARLGFHRLSVAVRRLLANATESARRLCAAARRPWRVAGFALLGALIFEIAGAGCLPPTARHAAGCAGVRLCRCSPRRDPGQPANCCANSAGRGGR
jgi:hypothetical protein